MAMLFHAKTGNAPRRGALQIPKASTGEEVINHEKKNLQHDEQKFPTRRSLRHRPGASPLHRRLHRRPEAPSRARNTAGPPGSLRVGDVRVNLPIRIYHDVTDYSDLLVDGEGLISWPYDEGPPLIGIIFEAEDKRFDFEEGNLVLTYASTVGTIMQRLEQKGITFERLKTLAGEALGDPEGVRSAFEEPEQIVDDEEEGIPLGWVQEALDSHGNSEILELIALLNHLETAKPDAPVVFDPSVVLDVISREEAETLDLTLLARARLRGKLASLQAILGFMGPPNPESIAWVKDHIGRMDEDDLLERVIVPVLRSEGFHQVEVVEHHGPGEFGADVRPMYKMEMGKRMYYAAQAKAQRIRPADATDVWSQLETALNVEFRDGADNLRKKVNMVYLFLGNGATQEALEYLYGKGTQQIRIFKPGEIAERVLANNLQGNLLQA